MTLSQRVTEYFARDDAAVTWWGIDLSTGGRYGRQLAFLRDETARRLSGAAALDVATGRGRFAITMAQHGARHVTAVEISPAMAAVATDNARQAGVSERLTVLVGDAATVGLPESHFAVATLMEVLVHLPDPLRVLRAIHDAMLPGGLLLTNYDTLAAPWITYPIDWWLARRHGKRYVMHSTVDDTLAALERGDIPTMRPRDAYHGLSTRTAQRLLTDAGFRVRVREPEYLRVKGVRIPVPVGYLVLAEKRSH